MKTTISKLKDKDNAFIEEQPKGETPMNKYKIAAMMLLVLPLLIVIPPLLALVISTPIVFLSIISIVLAAIISVPFVGLLLLGKCLVEGE